MVKGKRSYNKNLKRNGMLMRLLLTISVFICVPLLIINIFIISRDTKKIQQQEIENYQAYTDNFRDFFNDELDDMFACSIDLSVNKTVTETDIIGNTKYLWNAFSEIKKYKNSIPVLEDLFIYMSSINYVLGSEHGYMDSYFADIYMDKDLEWMETLSDNYVSGKYFVKAASNKMGMFAVYPASIRKTGDTTVFYYITDQTLNDAFYTLDDSDTESYIYSEDGELLLSNNKETNPVVHQTDFQEFLQDYSRSFEKIKAYGKEWYTFKSYDGENHLFFLNIVPAEKILQSMENIKTYNLFLLLLEVMLCIIMLFFVVHINYSPIGMLKRKYREDFKEGENEIEGIARLLAQSIADKHSLGNLVQERTEQLSVYVLRDMLNGEDIPEEQMKLINMNDAIKHVFVMAVQGIDADSDIEGEVVEHLTDEANMNKVIYSMVDSYEHCMMYVCFMTENDSNIRVRMAEKLRAILIEETLNQNFKLGVGEYCLFDDGLKTARLTALIALDQSVYGKIKYYENALNEFRHVEHYPNKQMLTYIRYLKEGNSEQALLQLDQIINSVQMNQPSVIMGRYVCYDIVNEFIQLVTSLDVKIEEGKIIKLMRFERLEELQRILADLTIIACQEIENRKLSVGKDQANKIIQFIDENISDPDLSREMIADRFKISVNTVSLLCTNLIGMGFRELIVARRIELAQKLFQETDMSVSEVAIQSGFRDTSYFIKIFKNITGKTPRVYKNGIKDGD